MILSRFAGDQGEWTSDVVHIQTTHDAKALCGILVAGMEVEVIPSEIKSVLRHENARLCKRCSKS